MIAPVKVDLPLDQRLSLQATRVAKKAQSIAGSAAVFVITHERSVYAKLTWHF